MSDLIAALKDLAETLGVGGVKAHVDPSDAYANRPCVLIAPPTLDYEGGTMTGPLVRYRLLALSSYEAGVFDALAELGPLVTDVDRVIGVARAEPIQYPLGSGTKVAAYLLTTTAYPLDTEE